MNRISRLALISLLSLLSGHHCLAQDGDRADGVADSSVQMENTAAQLGSNLFAKYTAPEDLVSDPMFILSVTPVQFVPEQPKRNHRLWFRLTVMGELAAAADASSTTLVLHKGGSEGDPLARPFTRLPGPAYIASSVALGGAVSVIELKMQESRRFHRVWWLPQALQIVGNSLCAAHNAQLLASW